jgi:hypothetical protein
MALNKAVHASLLPVPRPGKAYYLVVDGEAIAIISKKKAIALGYTIVEPERKPPLTDKQKNDRKAAKKRAAKLAELGIEP